jgi:hypothetical protein
LRHQDWTLIRQVLSPPKESVLGRRFGSHCVSCASGRRSVWTISLVEFIQRYAVDVSGMISIPTGSNGANWVAEITSSFRIIRPQRAWPDSSGGCTFYFSASDCLTNSVRKSCSLAPYFLRGTDRPRCAESRKRLGPVRIVLRECATFTRQAENQAKQDDCNAVRNWRTERHRAIMPTPQLGISRIDGLIQKPLFNPHDRQFGN